MGAVYRTEDNDIAYIAWVVTMLTMLTMLMMLTCRQRGTDMGAVLYILVLYIARVARPTAPRSDQDVLQSPAA